MPMRSIVSKKSRRFAESLLEQVTSGPKPVKLLSLLALSHYNICHSSHGEPPVMKRPSNPWRNRSSTGPSSPPRTHRSPSSEETSGKPMRSWPIIQHRAHQDDKAFSSLQMAIDILEKARPVSS